MPKLEDVSIQKLLKVCYTMEGGPPRTETDVATALSGTLAEENAALKERFRALEQRFAQPWARVSGSQGAALLQKVMARTAVQRRRQR